jgi:hypothetical protein
MTKQLITLAATLLLLAPLTASAADTCAGVTLPAKSAAFGAELVRNGVGVREATFLNVDVYVAGLYTARKTRSVEEVLKEGAAKLIVLRFVRDVSREEMGEALTDALRKNLGAEFEAANKRLQPFLGKLPPLNKGTELQLAYRPGHGVQLVVNGKTLGTETDDHTANLLFRAWLGPQPPDKDLKAGLLGGPCD